MPKAVALGPVKIAGVAQPFIANVAPDPYDVRDLPYRPRLQLLADAVDRRAEFVVLKQDGSSCTGHAVATMINTVLAQKQSAERVSPYMLYYLARRYDEFPGEDDAGSSLRGVLKGWWRHGVALEGEWPALHTHLDLTSAALVQSCRKRPLGAYYRVDIHRLDDMQSAITELHAIVASAQVHEGWRDVKPDANGNYVIKKSPNPIGGHAFALVGYNDIGFLVQNSWGTTWGKGGFATLPYEDWLECGFDAWVARPGVPQTPFITLDRTVSDDGAISVGVAPSAEMMHKHVLNLGNDGRLSRGGQATSSPQQIRDLVDAMNAAHAAWGSANTVLYFHGGLVGESSGLGQAQEQFQWWLNNHVYPIFVVWESGPMETVIDQLDDMLGKQAPAGLDIKGKIFEAIDRLAEKTAAGPLSFAWAQMKQNATAASAPLASLPANDQDWFAKPGASLLLRRLADKSPNMKLHLVAHSAGAVFVDGMLARLDAYGIGVESLAFLAAASTIDAFRQEVAPRLCNPIKRFANFTMSDQLELDDTCANIYHKSLLYLVSRGFEKPKQREVPMVGMQRFAPDLAPLINNPCSAVVVSGKTLPPGTPDDAGSTAQHHGAFHDDAPTMNSVMLRILGRHDVTTIQPFQKNSAPVALPGAAAARLRIKADDGARGKATKIAPSKPKPKGKRV